MCWSTVAQLVEQLPHNQEVVGSNPSHAVFFNFFFFLQWRHWWAQGLKQLRNKVKKTLAFLSAIHGLLGLPAPMMSPVSRGTETTCKRCKKDKFTLASRSAIRGLLGLPALEIVIGILLSNPRFVWLACYWCWKSTCKNFSKLVSEWSKTLNK